MNPRFFILFTILCLLPTSSVLSQQRINLAHESGGINLSYHLLLTSELIYKESGREVAIALEQLPNGILAIENHNFAVLRFTFQIPNEHSLFTLGRKADLEVEISGNSAFTCNIQKNLKLKKSESYRNHIDIPIPRSGTGSISVTIQQIVGKTFKPNKKLFDLSIYRIGSAASLSALPKGTIAQQKKFVTEHLQTLKNLTHFRDSKFSSLTIKSSGEQGLRLAETGLKDLFDHLNLGTSANQICNLYKVFGQKSLSRNNFTRPMHETAVQRINAADDKFVTDTPNKISSSDAKNRKNQYIALFCNSGYACKNKDYFDDLIASLATNISCGEIKTNYRRTKNKNTLIKLYKQCSANKCTDLCQQIQKKIDEVDCDAQLDDAINETNIIQKRSALNKLINDNNCSHIFDAAKTALAEIPVLKLIDGQDFLPKIIKDSIGRNLISFTILFESGKDIKIDSIDGDANWPLLVDYHSHKWNKTDKKVTLILENRLEPYQVVFRSATTSENVSRELTKEKFTAVLIEDNKLSRIITLKNGTPPFYARFSSRSGGQSFDYRLSDLTDTLFLDQLSQHHQGEYVLTILDNNGRSGLTEAHAVVLVNNSWPLWLKLLIPLIILSGFLLYRNLPLTKHE